MCLKLNINLKTINFSAGSTNAAEFCMTMMNFPSFPDLLKIVEQEDEMTV